MNRPHPRLLFLLLALCLAGCSTGTPSPIPLAHTPAAYSPPSTQAAASPVISASPTPTDTALPPTPAPTSGPRPCSPLQDVALSQITDLVSNPYHPPAPGSDDPHAGVDLAIRLPGSQVAVGGRPVQAALTGQVAMVTRDRFPFGNAVLIETPLDALPADWWSPAGIPTPAPTLALRSALTCPVNPAPIFPDPARRALYVLYAHLKDPSPLKAGDPVTCGQVIGAVGKTGNALNPHLHFETRVGPAGLRLDSMAHYENSATSQEMSNYCVWSVSGQFQLVNPLMVLQLAP